MMADVSKFILIKCVFPPFSSTPTYLLSLRPDLTEAEASKFRIYSGETSSRQRLFRKQVVCLVRNWRAGGRAKVF